MSAVSILTTIAGTIYPPAAPVLAWVGPIADALWTNRAEIAELVKSSKTALEAINQVAPSVLPKIEDLASKIMLQWPGKTHQEVTAGLAAKAVSALVPGWTDEEATRWMDHQNARY